MANAVEFHFDLGSPNAYLAHRVIPAIEGRTGATFRYVPVLLGGIFKATNNVSPVVAVQGVKNKGEYLGIELRRFQRTHGIGDFAFNPHFPVNTLKPMRGALVAQREGILGDYVDAMFRHMWSAPKKLDDDSVLRSALVESGLPADLILEGISDPAIKAELIANTEASVARGVFGVPSFFVGDELFFGKDTLRDVEDEIVRQRGPRP